MKSFGKLAAFSLLLAFAFASTASAAEGCHGCKKKCQTLYLDNFALPTIEDPLEPLNAGFGASNWVSTSFTNGLVEYTDQSFSRKEGVYTIFNKGISLIPNAIQIVGNFKTLTNSFAVKKGETQRYSADISLTLDVTDVPPEWIPHLVSGGIDVDPRPADCAFILSFIQPSENDTVSIQVTGCYFFAKNAVWAYHDMAELNANFEIVGDRPFFSHAKLVAEFDTSEKHTYAIEYHRGCKPKDSDIKWIIDGKVVRTQTNLGSIPTLEENDLFVLAAINVPCNKLLQSKVDASLAQLVIGAGQQAHSYQAIVGSPGEQGLAPSPQFAIPQELLCFPTSFVLPEPQLLKVKSSLSIYRLEVKSCFKP